MTIARHGENVPRRVLLTIVGPALSPDGTRVAEATDMSMSSLSESAEAALVLLPEGTILHGTYQILRHIASGGMGDVYEAAHLRLPGRFALKVLRPDLVNNREAFSRFCREGEIMSQLQHPNIVQVFDFNQTGDGTPYLAMEFVHGEDLGLWLASRQRAVGDVVSVVKQIAAAVTAAHTHGVIHRDLKPENILVCSVEGNDAFVKVLDFGISSAAGTGHLTGASIVLGTAQYMSPEQAEGRNVDVDSRSDVFALATITYELLTGTGAFRGDSALGILYQVVNCEPEPIGRFVTWPSAGVEAVLKGGMAKRREDRYESAMAFATALENAVAEVYRATTANVPDAFAAVERTGEVRLREPTVDTDLDTTRTNAPDLKIEPLGPDEMAWTGQARRRRFAFVMALGMFAFIVFRTGPQREIDDVRFMAKMWRDGHTPVPSRERPAPIASESESEPPQAPAEPLGTARGAGASENRAAGTMSSPTPRAVRSSRSRSSAVSIPPPRAWSPSSAGSAPLLAPAPAPEPPPVLATEAVLAAAPAADLVAPALPPAPEALRPLEPQTPDLLPAIARGTKW